MSGVAVAIEGGLFAADLLERIAAGSEGVDGQRPQDFGLAAGTRMSDEIQDAFSRAVSHWTTFQRRRLAASDSATTLTRQHWVKPLLEDLGFELVTRRAHLMVGGQGYGIVFTDGEGEAPVPVHVVPFEQDLDRRGDKDRLSPHGLVQDYLNRSDGLWGLVTNGRRLRILRATTRLSRPVFLELDLEAIAGGGLYAEFHLLYRLLHRSRFPRGGEGHACLLERWHQQGIDEGGRVREHLRDGVEAAIVTLGNAFLAHDRSADLRDRLTDDRLGGEDYYRELLRLVYRLLFLMVAEERRLLLLPDKELAERQAIYTRWYSLERLRARAEARRGPDPHPDLWQGLCRTFDIFREPAKAAALGLGVLNGELFGPRLTLETAQIRNDHLLEAIRSLSTFTETTRTRRKGVRRRVSFGALDVEELGSVYEGLLDFHPHVDVGRRELTLLTGSERKSTGSYYTPHELVEELIRTALVPVLEERVAAAADPAAKEAAILGLRVIDPAAGSGHFLLAAARRMARTLAAVRTGEAEPSPADFRHALRDVIRSCVYAVDKNPLAVDLCKVALWIESQEPGRPLSFLDHHVRCGDALMGVLDLAAVTSGIPDAAYKPLTGDVRQAASDLRKRNVLQARGVQTLDFFGGADVARATGGLAAQIRAIAALNEDDPAGVAEKARRWSELRQLDPDFRKLKLACDLWCAAFFTPKRSVAQAGQEAVPTSDHVFRALAGQAVQGMGVIAAVVDAQRFFHWPLEFPEVMEQGGFDVVLGNPPWEVMQLSEEEFFATLDKNIAEAANAAERRLRINRLKEAPKGSPQCALYEAFEAAKRASEAGGLFVRESGRFPLTAEGKINTYALFAENGLRLRSPEGRSGLVLPSGIATADQTKRFFQYLLDLNQLVSLVNFAEIRDIFLATDDRNPFGLMTIGSHAGAAQFAFSCMKLEDAADLRRRFTLSADDIALLNPNTRTCPVFRTANDAELTKKIYARVPVLIDEGKGDAGNPWGITFRQGLFNMASDSGLFRTRAQLAAAGGRLEGNAFVMPEGERWLPLYEAKMVHHFDHRWFSYPAAGSVTGGDDAPETSTNPRDPDALALPRYWVEERLVEQRLADKGWHRGWLMGWRDICRSTDERTVIASVIPRVAVGHTAPLFFAAESPRTQAALLANWTSLVLDYLARQKVGGTHLTYGYLNQLPFLLPTAYNDRDLTFITSHVLKLTYTAHDLDAWARDLGHEGPPFAWNPERRAQLRAELDAYYAYLYGLTKDELRYVLDPKEVMGEDFPSETFRVLKEKEQRLHGEYRTRRLVLDAWDRFEQDGTFDLARMAEPSRAALQARLASTEAELATVRPLIERAQAARRPVLYLEGSTDIPIIEAAWAAFFPGQPLPVTILGAGGTRQMDVLAGEGTALRPLIGDKVILVLVDNDGAGRQLAKGKRLGEGGEFVLQKSGLVWSMLKPSAELKAVMRRFGVQPDRFACTVEQMFTAATRKQAAEAGIYAVSRNLCPDFRTGLPDRGTDAMLDLGPEDDAYWYVHPPKPDAKEAFAAWITAPERCTAAVFAAFEPILRGLAQAATLTPAGSVA